MTKEQIRGAAEWLRGKEAEGMKSSKAEGLKSERAEGMKSSKAEGLEGTRTSTDRHGRTGTDARAEVKEQVVLCARCGGVVGKKALTVHLTFLSDHPKGGVDYRERMLCGHCRSLVASVLSTAMGEWKKKAEAERLKRGREERTDIDEQGQARTEDEE